MTLIRRPTPFTELRSLRSVMDHLLDETQFRPVARGTGQRTLAMPLDIHATQDALVVEAALPGVRPDDVDVSILGDTLTLTATSAADRPDQQHGYHVREVRRGRFPRTLTLPAGLQTDAATATFELGMLRLSFPRAVQARARQIPVTAPVEATAAHAEDTVPPVNATTSVPTSSAHAQAPAAGESPVSD